MNTDIEELLCEKAIGIDLMKVTVVLSTSVEKYSYALVPVCKTKPSLLDI